METPKRLAIRRTEVEPPVNNREALLTLLGSPDLCSKRWVWEQYDHIIQGNTVQRPGGDAAVIRVNEAGKGLAVTCDVTPRYVEADPFEGGKQAVAECYRNLSAVGSLPIALTDNLNFGNPERPEIMGQFALAIRGIGEAARVLDFPVVSGNVSLYNETNGQGILPTPTIGGVGLIADVTKTATLAFKNAGDAIIVVGETKGWLGASAYLATICGREEGAPPPVDLDIEKHRAGLIRAMIEAGVVTAVHDISDGGVGIALAEMALAGNIGAMIGSHDADVPLHAWLFGEDQGRYIITCPAQQAASLEFQLNSLEVPTIFVGVVGGEMLTLPGELPISLSELRKAHEGWLPAYMGAEAAE